jgi:hypothetical protein
MSTHDARDLQSTPPETTTQAERSISTGLGSHAATQRKWQGLFGLELFPQPAIIELEARGEHATRGHVAGACAAGSLRTDRDSAAAAPGTGDFTVRSGSAASCIWSSGQTNSNGSLRVRHRRGPSNFLARRYLRFVRPPSCSTVASGARSRSNWQPRLQRLGARSWPRTWGGRPRVATR